MSVALRKSAQGLVMCRGCPAQLATRLGQDIQRYTPQTTILKGEPEVRIIIDDRRLTPTSAHMSGDRVAAA